jgi:23S rRNA (guanosine2251-2'-O)-methyltransferase
MPKLALIAHNLRSSHNVGSLLRTAEGLGVSTIYLTGYTPYPLAPKDERLPHIAQKVDKQIAKTALGAEKLASWHHQPDIYELADKLKKDGFRIVALEQAPNSTKLFEYKPPQKLAIIVGREVEGLEPEILELCDQVLEIPMVGRKESFNVVQAAAMAMYQMTFIS